MRAGVSEETGGQGLGPSPRAGGGKLSAEEATAKRNSVLHISLSLIHDKLNNTHLISSSLPSISYYCEITSCQTAFSHLINVTKREGKVILKNGKEERKSKMQRTKAAIREGWPTLHFQRLCDPHLCPHP